VLAPREMKDINDNLSEVYFDVLGLPTAMAVKGKGTEGDSLTGYTDALANPELPKLTAFFVEKPYDETQARDWLGNATARHVYYFGEIEEKLPDGTPIIRWGQHPACACGIVREKHVAQLEANEKSPIQTAFEYSDGMALIEQQFGADASDIACSANNENFHRGSWGASARRVKQTARGAR
jgi:hypothetical protein